MIHTVHTFLTSKEGEPREDCEDSIHPAPGSAAGDEPLGAFAVADGVTTSFFGGLWARMLTARFAECPAAVFEQPWPGWLAAPQEQWQAAVHARAASETASFYTCNDVLSRRPAAATFVGVLLDPPAPDGAIPWRALVLGDSCLFILGKDGPRSLALTEAAEFSNIVAAAESYAGDPAFSPQLCGTTPHGSEPPLGEGDTVLLATDALSKWLLLRAEVGQPVWGTLLGLAGQVEFEELVAQARREELHPLENDDVALAIVHFGKPHAVYLDAFFEPQPRPDPPPKATSPEAAPPAPAPPPPPQTPSAWDLGGCSHVLPAGVSRSPWLGPALLGVILALAVALVWQTVRQQRQETKIAALAASVAAESAAASRLGESLWQVQTDTWEVKKKLARMQVELGSSAESFQSVSQKLEATEQEFATHRCELEVTTRNLAALRKESETRLAILEQARTQAERTCAERERKAGIAHQDLQKAQEQITRLEAEQQALKANLAACGQELKALREPPEPTQVPPPPPPADPPAGSP